METRGKSAALPIRDIDSFLRPAQSQGLHPVKLEYNFALSDMKVYKTVGDLPV